VENALLSNSQKSIFYGWQIVNVLFWLNAVLMGTVFVFGVFFKSLEAQFNVSRSTTSSIVSVYMVVMAGVAVLGGWALDRFGPKRLVLIMGLLTGLGLLLTSQVHAVWQFFITYSLLLALGSGATYVVSMPLIIRWFEKKRGIATGITMAGVSIGQVILAPLATFFIVNFSWRVGFIVLGLLPLLVIVPLSFVLKRDPAEIGLLPDGREPLSSEKDKPQTPVPAVFSTIAVFRNRSFWFITILNFLMGICVMMLSTHIAAHATDIGFSAEEGATIISIIGITSIIGNFLGGVITDRAGAKVTVIISALGMAVAMIWLTAINRLWQIDLFAVLYGLANGSIVPSAGTLYGQTFDATHIGKIMGMIYCSWAIGAAIGPFIGGVLFDLRGNYILAFWVAAIAMAIAAVMAVLIGRGATQLPAAVKGKRTNNGTHTQ
jgi:MFS family permease